MKDTPIEIQSRTFAIRFRRGSRGAVMVEYAFLLVAIAIPAMVGISAGGVGMLKKFNRTRDSILQSSP